MQFPAVAVTPDGCIIVAGHSLTSDYYLVVWKYLDDGTPDYSFQGTGHATHDGAGGTSTDEYGLAVAVDGAGTIWVTGYDETSAGDLDMVLWHFFADGSLDTVITSDGAAGTPGGDEVGRDIVLDGRGRVVIVGEGTGSTGTQDLVIWRFH